MIEWVDLQFLSVFTVFTRYVKPFYQITLSKVFWYELVQVATWLPPKKKLIALKKASARENQRLKTIRWFGHSWRGYYWIRSFFRLTPVHILFTLLNNLLNPYVFLRIGILYFVALFIYLLFILQYFYPCFHKITMYIKHTIKSSITIFHEEVRKFLENLTMDQVLFKSHGSRHRCKVKLISSFVSCCSPQDLEGKYLSRN